MTAFVECSGCRYGHHENHIEVIELSFDEDVCPCTGDCAERLLQRQAEADQWKQKKKERAIKKAIQLLEDAGYEVSPGHLDVIALEAMAYIVAEQGGVLRDVVWSENESRVTLKQFAHVLVCGTCQDSLESFDCLLPPTLPKA